MRGRVTGVVLAAALLAAGLAVAAQEQDPREPAGETTLVFVDPEEGATFTTDGDEFADVATALDVRRPGGGENLTEETGPIYLFLYTRSYFVYDVANATGPGNGVTVPTVPLNQSQAIEPEGGTVEAYRLLRAGNFAVLEQPFITVEDVPEGEYVLYAQLAQPAGDSVPERARDTVRFTVTEGEEGILPVFPTPDGEEAVEPDGEEQEEDGVVVTDEPAEQTVGEEDENEDAVLGEEEVGEPVVGPNEPAGEPVTPDGSPLLAIILGVVAFLAVAAATFMAFQWRNRE